MEVQIAVAKINKYASTESGDTLEVVERPKGGVSVVLADGQTSGRGAKAISMMVVRKVIGLLAEGVRDGYAARAASDALYTDKNGKVSCTMNIASIDLESNTVVLSCNNPVPIFICHADRVDWLDTASSSLGIRRDIRPVITELELTPGLTNVMYTNGLTHAGKWHGHPMDVYNKIRAVLEEGDPSPNELSDALLAHAVSLDKGRPADDISVVVLKVRSGVGDAVRRMSVRLPIR